MNGTTLHTRSAHSIRHVAWTPVVAALAILTMVPVFTMAPTTASAYTMLYTCGPAWANTPVSYRVNEEGVSSISLDNVRRIFENSFEAWSAPCCSSFSATDGGLTPATGENQNDSIWAMSFRETSWPQYLGDVNSTLGVTMPLVRDDCVIVSADVVFNNVSFTFIDGNPSNRSNDADLASIATHEFGHFLGLGHSGIFEATMYAAYVGGIGARTLHSDDEDGVCRLYQQGCSCTSSTQCNNDQQCIDGQCQLAPCTSDTQCDPGLSCISGDCVIPPCGSDADCISGYICASDGACLPNPDCVTCAQCTQNADCGTNGVCVEAGVFSQNSHCTAYCNDDSECPGDSQCFGLETQDGTYWLCFNADANENGICHDSYVCIDSNSGTADNCAGVTCGAGTTCNPSSGQCIGDGGNTGNPGDTSCNVCQDCTGAPNSCGDGRTCLAFDGGPAICSESCGPNGECPGNSTCFELSDGNSYCLNGDAGSVGVCGGGWTCSDGGSTGGGGACTICSDCTANPDICGDGNTCLAFDDGPSVCSSSCNDGTGCPGDSTCFELSDGNSYCLNANAGDVGVCGGGWTCAGGSGTGAPQSCNICSDCTANPDSCGAGNTCLSFDDGPSVCSTACGSGASCPGDSTCFELSNGNSYCLNANAGDVGVCGGGWSCTVATTGPCEGVLCDLGQSCNSNTGLCEGERRSGGDAAGSADAAAPDEGCAVSRAPASSVWTLALLMLMGLLAGWRRRGPRHQG